MFKLQIRTRNSTASPLRKAIDTKVRTVFRLGSNTSTQQVFPKGYASGKPIIEINTVEACHNSGNKILMKECFDELNVKSAEWDVVEQPGGEVTNWEIFPAIIKHKNSAKGKGIYMINSIEEYEDFINDKNRLYDYIIEKYYNYSKEYRLHVTKDGCFYTCRKMLKQNATDRWHRHDSNSVWIVEENPLFEKPKNWDDVVNECVKALNAVGLDIGACDVKIQSEKGKPNSFIPNFIIMEINSAPAMGSRTLIEYEKILNKIVN